MGFLKGYWDYPNKEIECTIDLVTGTASITNAPYRIAPA